MTYEIVSSCSNGNNIILEKFIALDMGVPFSKVKDKLKDIKLIFISHKHT